MCKSYTQETQAVVDPVKTIWAVRSNTWSYNTYREVPSGLPARRPLERLGFSVLADISQVRFSSRFGIPGFLVQIFVLIYCFVVRLVRNYVSLLPSRKIFVDLRCFSHSLILLDLIWFPAVITHEWSLFLSLQKQHFFLCFDRIGISIEIK